MCPRRNLGELARPALGVRARRASVVCAGVWFFLLGFAGVQLEPSPMELESQRLYALFSADNPQLRLARDGLGEAEVVWELADGARAKLLRYERRAAASPGVLIRYLPPAHSSDTSQSARTSRSAHSSKPAHTSQAAMHFDDGVYVVIRTRDLRHPDERALRALPELLDIVRRDDPELLKRLRSEIADEAHFRFESLVSAWVLDADDFLVTPEGVFHASVSTAGADVSRGLASTTRATDTAMAALEHWAQSSELSPPGRRSLLRLVAHALQPDPGIAHPDSALVVGLIQKGWLEQLTAPDPSGSAVRERISRAQRWQRPLIWTGSAGRFEERRRAGESLRIAAIGDSLRYRMAAPAMSFGSLGAPLETVVDLRPGSDPLDPDAEIQRIRVYLDHTVLASWTPGGGFSSDPATWRRALAPFERRLEQPSIRGIQGGLAPGPDRDPQGKPAGTHDSDRDPDLDPSPRFPPHLAVQTPDGRFRALHTANGSLLSSPLENAAQQDAFLERAARVLPDAAHLDLLGQYMFSYAPDSPDSRFPELLGVDQLQGEFHQTVAATLTRRVRGRFVGDCEDLAALYEAIVRKQGRIAHILSLPGHAALAFVEPARAEFVTHVLQSGPRRELHAPSVAESLQRAVQSFDPGRTVDPDQLALLLRFDDGLPFETYRLPSRVFTDAAYEARVVDLQRLWHQARYARAHAAARAWHASQPDDLAPVLEVAALERRMGRFAAAASHLADLETRSEPTHRAARVAIAEIDARFEAGQLERARELAERTRIAWTSAATLAADPGMPDRWLDLAEVLAAEDREPLLALEILDANARPLLTQDETWTSNRALVPALERFTEIATEAFTATLSQDASTAKPSPAGPDAYPRVRQVVERWFEFGAFRIGTHAERPLRAYAELGRYLESTFGKRAYRNLVESQIDRLPEPRNHAERARESERALTDARWIAHSPLYWSLALWDAYRHFARLPAKDRALPASRADMLRFAHYLGRARAASESLGLEDVLAEERILEAHLLVSLVSGDVSAANGVLDRVRAMRSQRATELAFDTLASVGPLLPLGTFAALVEAFDARFGAAAMPSFALDLAWSEGLRQHPEHAAWVARWSVARHPSKGSSEELEALRFELDELRHHSFGLDVNPSAP